MDRVAQALTERDTVLVHVLLQDHHWDRGGQLHFFATVHTFLVHRIGALSDRRAILRADRMHLIALDDQARRDSRRVDGCFLLSVLHAGLEYWVHFILELWIDWAWHLLDAEIADADSASSAHHRADAHA